MTGAIYFEDRPPGGRDPEASKVDSDYQAQAKPLEEQPSNTGRSRNPSLLPSLSRPMASVAVSRCPGETNRAAHKEGVPIAGFGLTITRARGQ